MTSYEDVQNSLNSQETKLSDALIKLESYATSQEDTFVSEWARLELAGYEGQDLTNSLLRLGIRNNHAETFINILAPYRRKSSDTLLASALENSLSTLSKQVTGEFHSLPAHLDRRYILDSVVSIEEESATIIGRQSATFLSRVRTEAKRNFQRFSPVSYAEPSFSHVIDNKELSSLLENRWREANITFRSGAYLSTIVLLGSILEGVLFSKVEQNVTQSNQAKSMPKNNGKPKRIKDCSLEEMINVCHECGWIDTDVRNFSKALRDYRNLVHPREQLKKSLRPDVGMCNVSFVAVQATIEDLSK